MTKEKPFEQTEFLLGSLDGYEQRRESEISERDSDIKEFTLSSENIETAGLFYGEENLNLIPENFNRSVIVDSLKGFQQTIFEYASHSDVRFGEFLIDTTWFKEMEMKFGEEYMQKVCLQLIMSG